MAQTILGNLVMFTAMQTAMGSKLFPDVTTFFPKINGNLTMVTWAHAVNSHELLNAALKSDDVMMLEADVALGTLTNSNSTEVIPIMCHPPTNQSDLSLAQFLEMTLSDAKKGIKLDYKSTEAFEQSKSTLKLMRNNMTVPVWLNADILPGPVNATDQPVDAKVFLQGAMEVLPESTLSIGWTTRFGLLDDKRLVNGTYTTEQIEEMVKTVRENNVTQPITYPVRAGLVANDLEMMKTLLEKTSSNKPTLTIWSHADDVVDGAPLSTLIKTIGVDRVYIDVPQDIWKDIDLTSASHPRAPLALTVLLAGLALAKIL